MHQPIPSCNFEDECSFSVTLHLFNGRCCYAKVRFTSTLCSFAAVPSMPLFYILKKDVCLWHHENSTCTKRENLAVFLCCCYCQHGLHCIRVLLSHGGKKSLQGFLNRNWILKDKITKAIETKIPPLVGWCTAGSSHPVRGFKRMHSSTNVEKNVLFVDDRILEDWVHNAHTLPKFAYNYRNLWMVLLFLAFAFFFKACAFISENPRLYRAINEGNETAKNVLHRNCI